MPAHPAPAFADAGDRGRAKCWCASVAGGRRRLRRCRRCRVRGGPSRRARGALCRRNGSHGSIGRVGRVGRPGNTTRRTPAVDRLLPAPDGRSRGRPGRPPHALSRRRLARRGRMLVHRSLRLLARSTARSTAGGSSALRRPRRGCRGRTPSTERPAETGCAGPGPGPGAGLLPGGADLVPPDQCCRRRTRPGRGRCARCVGVAGGHHADRAGGEPASRHPDGKLDSGPQHAADALSRDRRQQGAGRPALAAPAPGAHR